MKNPPSECSNDTAQAQDWNQLIGAEKEKDYFRRALAFVEVERRKGVTIYPEKKSVFNAFKLTSLADLRVVIIGQDPYHGPKQAHGLCFSVEGDVAIPPSLRNIYQELNQDLKLPIPNHGNLSCWAEQGVLLLNTVLTVEAGKAHSHKAIGWETFTDHVIHQISNSKKHVVFLLWGAHAQKKSALIDKVKHTVLSSVHPSPLSAHRGFFGCRHFSLCNQALTKHGQKPINWAITNSES